MNSQSRPFALIIFAFAFALSLTTPSIQAHETASPAATPGRVVTPLMAHPVEGMPGKLAQMLIVEYAPGYEAPSHTHPGLLYGYVLEGRFTTEVEGQPLTTYTKGQAFYEPAGAEHRISRNPSATEPLKLLIFIVAEEGKPLAAPVKP
jgi:quercetin dioxygenase-like cupin family protein